MKKNISKVIIFTVFSFLTLGFGLLPAFFNIKAAFAMPSVSVPFILPLSGNLVVKFRQEYFDDIKLVTRKHTGVDIAGSPGELARAAGNGIVAYTGFSNIGGRTIVIQHNAKIRSTYLNIRECFAIKGMRVSQGDIIASIGAGDDPSYKEAHLHFGIIYENSYLDPEDVLGIDYTNISGFISLKDISPDIGIRANRE